MAKRKATSTTRSTSKFNLDRWLARSKASLRTAAKKAQEDTGGFAEYDDGRYKMQVRSASIGPSNSSGRIQVTTEWKFLGGEYKGKTYRSYRGMDDEQGQLYFLLDAKRLGYELEDFDPSDIPDLLQQMAKDKPVMSVTLRTKGDFQNLLINGPAEDDDEDEEEVEDDADVEDEEDEEEEEDEAPAPRRKKAKAKKAVVEDDEDEEEEEEDDEEEDEDEEEEEAPAPRRKAKAKAKAKVVEDEDEDEEEEDEDGEEIAVSVGSIVKVKIRGKLLKAEVTEIFEDDQEIKVKTPAGKTVRIPADEILAVIDMPRKSKPKAKARRK